MADGTQDRIVEFSAFGGEWVCADSIIIHLPDRVEDVQRQVRCKVESQAQEKKGSLRPEGEEGA